MIIYKNNNYKKLILFSDRIIFFPQRIYRYFKTDDLGGVWQKSRFVVAINSPGHYDQHNGH